MNDSIVVNYLRTRASDGRAYGVPYDTGVGPARIRMLTVEEQKEQKEREEAWEKREHKMTVVALAERIVVAQNWSSDEALKRAGLFIEHITDWIKEEQKEQEYKLAVVALAERITVAQNWPFGDVIEYAERFIEEATAWMNKE